MANDFGKQPHGPAGGLGPGRKIANYVVEAQIGVGGMAVVFRARDELLGRPVAVKVITPMLADDQEFRLRFLRESRAAAAVDSLHIIPVYGAGESDGRLYIATRYVAGGDLSALLARAGGRLEARRAVALLTQVASALDAAHSAGLVHRDVKPQNILVDSVPERPEHAYLSDFGLSKGTLSPTRLTLSGQFVGTPDYSAPEQIKGGYVDGRADQYALACVTFALLTGTLPFHRGETIATMYAHLQDPVPPVTGIRQELPPALDSVLTRALAKLPADRYARCGEFTAALQEALDRPRPAAATGPWSWLGMDHGQPRAAAAQHARPQMQQHTAGNGWSPAAPPAPYPVPGPAPAFGSNPSLPPAGGLQPTQTTGTPVWPAVPAGQGISTPTIPPGKGAGTPTITPAIPAGNGVRTPAAPAVAPASNGTRPASNGTGPAGSGTGLAAGPPRTDTSTDTSAGPGVGGGPTQPPAGGGSSDPSRPRRRTALIAGAAVLVLAAAAGTGYALQSGGSAPPVPVVPPVKSTTPAAPVKPALAATLTVPGGGTIDTMWLSPDGKRLAAAGAGSPDIYIWNTASPAHPTTLTAPSTKVGTRSYSPVMENIAFSADDSTVTAVTYPSGGPPTASTQSYTVYQWNLATGKRTTVWSTSTSSVVTFSLDNNLAVNSVSGGVSAVSLTSASKKAAPPVVLPGGTNLNAGTVYYLDLDGNRMIYRPSSGGSYVWDFAEKKVIAKLQSNGNNVLSPDGKTALVFYNPQNNANIIPPPILWDFATQSNVTPSDPRWQQQQTSSAEAQAYTAFGTDGSVVATRRGNGEEWDLWSTVTHKYLTTVTDPDYRTDSRVAVAGPGGREVVIFGAGKTVGANDEVHQLYLWNTNLS
jgi:serine/threonine-protein kinase